MKRFVSTVTTAILIILFGLALSACSRQGLAGANYGATVEATAAGAETEQAEPAPQTEAGQAEVVMENTAYHPQQLTVQPGTTVTWTNEDDFPHTVISGTRDNPTDQFDSGEIPAGETFSFTFEEAGTFDYFCTIHSGMKGQVLVE